MRLQESSEEESEEQADGSFGLKQRSCVHISADSLKDIFCIGSCLRCAILSCIMIYVQCLHSVWMKRSLASI